MKKKPINHEKRKGGPYDSKPETSDELRQKRSELMKEFNRKTGKLTQQAHSVAFRRRLEKSPA
jgi:hypothetical protein